MAREGSTVRCHPLGGTTGLSGDGTPDDRLLRSAKELEEHRLVVAGIQQILEPLCDRLTVPSAPEVLRLGTDARLGTRIEGHLTPAPHGGTPSALDLLAALHPTPAVGGVPTSVALDLIVRSEEVPRGHWAGPVGWVDAQGDGEWVIGIRSLQLEGTRAIVWGGAGVVAGSDPEAELAETTLKLDAVVEELLAQPATTSSITASAPMT